MRQRKLKHLITWKDWEDEEILRVLQLAKQIKQSPQDYLGQMLAKTLVMIFQKTSTRTRVSFEAAMTEMGGHAIYLDWKSSQFHMTKPRYEAAYLSTNSHLIMARVKKHSDLVELQTGARVPLINGCCNLYHPCQAMADMLTILLDRGEVKGTRLAYLGVHNNVVNSLVELCSALGVHLYLVTPIAPKEAVDFESLDRLDSMGLLTRSLDMDEAVAKADYVYTDTWVDMEFFTDPAFAEQKEERIKTMLPYQLNEKLLQHSKAKVMHDMPIHPGYEIAEELVESPRSVIFEQASNRLPAQKAIMLSLLYHI